VYSGHFVVFSEIRDIGTGGEWGTMRRGCAPHRRHIKKRKNL